MGQKSYTVDVYYKYADGGHFFWCNEQLAAGLLVSDLDVVKAIEKVSDTLQRRTGVNWMPNESAVAFLANPDNNMSLYCGDGIKTSLAWLREGIAA